jgi:hypothetical protein
LTRLNQSLPRGRKCPEAQFNSIHRARRGASVINRKGMKMTQIKTRLSERRARAKGAARDIIKRYPIATLPHKVELANARNGELLVLYDDEIIATRGDRCWVTLKEGIAVFDSDDRRNGGCRSLHGQRRLS